MFSISCMLMARFMFCVPVCQHPCSVLEAFFLQRQIDGNPFGCAHLELHWKYTVLSINMSQQLTFDFPYLLTSMFRLFPQRATFHLVPSVVHHDPVPHGAFHGAGVLGGLGRTVVRWDGTFTTAHAQGESEAWWLWMTHQKVGQRDLVLRFFLGFQRDFFWRLNNISSWAGFVYPNILIVKRPSGMRERQILRSSMRFWRAFPTWTCRWKVQIQSI